ncbi:MAG TPA: GDSL-type esterase/lipase family protein [Terracidiphilus sp.]|nr:GDSL-type esterase/lipase family protein [Terracidiphilus sp.]
MTRNIAAAHPEQSVTASRTIVAFLGSSSTAGKGQAFDFIGELKRRPGCGRFDFRNFGVGGDLAYNALQRLPQVVACSPEKVVVWVGANDVLALVSPKVARFFRMSKHLPVEPSLDWFRENIRAIAHRLKMETTASIAFCSLPPIGEDPASAVAFQSRLNRGIEEYSETIRDVALKENVGYIPLHENMLEQIQASPGRAFTSFRFLPFYRDAFRVIALRKTPDEVAKLNGWRFHSDGVHLNSRGGIIAADLIQQFLD